MFAPRPLLGPFQRVRGMRVGSAVVLTFLVIVPMVGGCDVGPDAAGAVWNITGPAELRIGTGFPSFEPLEDGQRIPIIHGRQDGYHVWGGFRVGGIYPDDVEIRFELLDGDSVVGRAVYEDDIGRGGPTNGDEVAGGADPVFEYAAVAVIFGPQEIRDVSLVDGADLLLTLSLTDRRGTRVSDSVNVTTICCER